jgi:hypothetical protein
LGVAWQEQPRDKGFPDIVFPMQTLTEISDGDYRNLLEGSGSAAAAPSEAAEAIDQIAFVLEKYLEDVIVSNFDKIFKGKLHIYEDAGEKAQQYPTDIGPIDIWQLSLIQAASSPLNSRRAALLIKSLVKFFATWGGSKRTSAKTAKM